MHLFRCFAVAAAAGMIRRDAVRARKDNEGVFTCVRPLVNINRRLGSGPGYKELRGAVQGIEKTAPYLPLSGAKQSYGKKV